jgi:hypothetical protein
MESALGGQAESRMLRRFATIVLLAGIAGGCGSGKPAAVTDTLPALMPTVTVSKEAAKHPYDDDEKSYLRKLHGWLVTVGGASDRLAWAADGPARAKLLKGKLGKRLKPALVVLRTCDARLRELGEPPSARLTAGVKALTSSCARMSHAARAVQRSLATNDPSGLAVVGDDLDKAEAAYYVAEQALMPIESRDLKISRAPSTTSRVDTRYGDAVQDVFETGVEVRCWSKDDWKKVIDESSAFTVEPGVHPAETFGFVLGGDRANLSPVVCAALDDLVYREQRPAGGAELRRLALGLVVLTHETEHVTGVALEAEAECYAMQDAPDVGMALGLTKAYARKLAETYWRTEYPRDPPRYRSKQCRNDGALDLYRDDLWP